MVDVKNTNLINFPSSVYISQTSNLEQKKELLKTASESGKIDNHAIKTKIHEMLGDQAESVMNKDGTINLEKLESEFKSISTAGKDSIFNKPKKSAELSISFSNITKYLSMDDGAASSSMVDIEV